MPRGKATKRRPTKRTAAKRTTTKRRAARRTPTKRRATKRTAAKRSATKRTPTKRTPTKRKATKRTAAKHTAAKRPPTKRTPTKRRATKLRAVHNLNVFISWSGTRSKCLAVRLRQILPAIVPNIDILFSAAFTGGSAWMDALKNAIETADFAILCVTQDNLDSLWMNFEAGALWRNSQPDVWPLLLDIKPDKLQGRPIFLIQAKEFEETDFEQLCKMLAEKTAMDLERFKTNFEALWPTLSADVQNDLQRLP
jgi:hypothetical protein